MDDNVYASMRMTESITQKGSRFDQVCLTKAISKTSCRSQLFNLRALMFLPIIFIGLVLLLEQQQAEY